MALNKYMHPRNPYKTKKPNFKELAIKYPEFREKVTQNLSGKVILDFKDPDALRALTVALLRDDFDLKVNLPIDRLIPTVPQRLNYILWLEDIFDQAKDLNGIDIGAGASCIYPLLGCRQNGWSFLASEVDDQNLEFASKNIQQNNMENKITVKKVPEDTLLIGLVEDDVSYDFCMCNPPFYSDHLEAQGITTSRSDERPEPMSVSTASEIESISWGGEVKFVSRMIEESLVLKNRIRVYTSLIGKKINLSLLKDELIRRKITKFSSTEFCQGKTMRWGLAWTFDDTVNFPKSAFKTLKNLKPPLSYTISRDNPAVTDYTVQAFTKYMIDTFDELKIKYNIIHSGKFYAAMHLQAKENTWSHQRRKKRQKLHQEMQNPTAVLEAEHMDRNEQESSKTYGDETGNGGTEHQDDEIQSVKSPNKIANKRDSGMHSMETGDTVREISIAKKEEVDSLSEHKDAKILGSPEILQNTNNTEVKEEKQKPSEKGTEVVNISDNRPEKHDRSVGCSICQVVVSDKKVLDSNGNNNLKNDEALMTHTISNADLETVTSCPGCKRKHEKSGESEPASKKIKIGDKRNPQHDKGGIFDTEQETNKVKEHKEFIAGTTNVVHVENSGNNMQSEDQIQTNYKEGQSSLACKEDEIMSSDTNQITHLRKDVLEEFQKEKEINAEIEMLNKDPTKKTKYHNFDETEECLVMFKMVLRKEDGIVTLTMEYKTGNKEAMHQIMQYFKNKFGIGSPQKC